MGGEAKRAENRIERYASAFVFDWDEENKPAAREHITSFKPSFGFHSLLSFGHLSRDEQNQTMRKEADCQDVKTEESKPQTKEDNQ